MNKPHSVVGLVVKGTSSTGYTVALDRPKTTQNFGFVTMPSADELRKDLESQLDALQSDLDSRFPQMELNSI
ncbi:hypothetical protein [Oceanimonas smirnovii]|uniref:hypothetical protein n=1 Tax=Oceanimonas smirnovii TaxID=264574 RepID=UPI003FD26196